MQLLSENTITAFENFQGTIWTGDSFGVEGGAFTSALPIYIGLMAIAGAYIIKEARK